jgi:hypothetical protein
MKGFISQVRWRGMAADFVMLRKKGSNIKFTIVYFWYFPFDIFDQ